MNTQLAYFDSLTLKKLYISIQSGPSAFCFVWTICPFNLPIVYGYSMKTFLECMVTSVLSRPSIEAFSRSYIQTPSRSFIETTFRSFVETTSRDDLPTIYRPSIETPSCQSIRMLSRSSMETQVFVLSMKYFFQFPYSLSLSLFSPI